LQPGIESLSTSVLRLMRKGCTFLQNVQFLKWTKQFGISGTWNFLYGFPGEDRDAYQRVASWVPALVHLRPPEICSRIRFDRFSPYFTEPEQFGVSNRRAHAAYGYVYSFDDDVLARLAYYFEYDFSGKSAIDDYAKPAVDMMTDWQKSGGSAVLEAHIEPDELLIIDSRFAERSDYRVRGLEREIYLYCDEIRSFNAIARNFPQDAPETIQRLLDSFLAKRLMANEDNSYLSLAVLHGEAMPKIEPALKQLAVIG